MENGIPKSIIDAERYCRALEKPANQLPWFGGGANSKSAEQVPKTTSNGTSKAPKWDPKPMQNQTGAAEAFGECSRSPKSLRVTLGEIVLGSILGPVLCNNKKKYLEKHAQINLNKYRILKPKWSHK